MSKSNVFIERHQDHVMKKTLVGNGRATMTTWVKEIQQTIINSFLAQINEIFCPEKDMTNIGRAMFSSSS